MKYYSIKFSDGTFLTRKALGIGQTTDIQDCRIFKSKGAATTIVNEMHTSAMYRAVREQAKDKSPENYTELEAEAFRRKRSWNSDHKYNSIPITALSSATRIEVYIVEVTENQS